MAEPITVSLSKTNALRFAEREEQIAKLVAAKNQDVTTLLANHCEPDDFVVVLRDAWPYTVSATEIVFTPPAAPLALMPDDVAKDA